VAAADPGRDGTRQLLTPLYVDVGALATHTGGKSGGLGIVVGPTRDHQLQLCPPLLKHQAVKKVDLHNKGLLLLLMHSLCAQQ
jgi:hypothetical protein